MKVGAAKAEIMLGAVHLHGRFLADVAIHVPGKEIMLGAVHLHGRGINNRAEIHSHSSA